MCVNGWDSNPNYASQGGPAAQNESKPVDKSGDIREKHEVWVRAEFVGRNPCGVTVVRVRQGGQQFMIGVDKSEIHELSIGSQIHSTSRLDPIK